MHRNNAASFIVSLMVSATLAAQQPPTPSTFDFEGATKTKYKQAGKDDLHLHVFYPPNWKREDRRSAIVFFFGGGWVGGTPGQFVPQCQHLAKRGMVAITAEYRVRNRLALCHESFLDSQTNKAKTIRGKHRQL